MHSRSFFSLIALSMLLPSACMDPSMPGGGAQNFPNPVLTNPPNTAGTFVIRDLSTPFKRLDNGGQLDLQVTVEKTSSGRVARYGLKLRTEQVVRPFEGVLPVIPGGKLTLQIKPTPRFSSNGPAPAEFWLYDEDGTESNHLGLDLTIQ